MDVAEVLFKVAAALVVLGVIVIGIISLALGVGLGVLFHG